MKEESCSYRQCLKYGEETLAAAGIEEAGNDAWMLFSEIFQMSRVKYYMDMNRLCDPQQMTAYEEWISLRADRIPLQQIIGRAPFMGYEFDVDEHVLIPRQDTEILVEQTFEQIKKADIQRKRSVVRKTETDIPKQILKILDMCTGSGCIAISLACMAEEAGIPCEITAVDLSEEALKVAEKNNRKLCRGSVKLIQSNLFAALPETLEFDIIVSNPPYIKSREIEGLMPEVRDHEPRMALDGTEDGLCFYRKLAEDGRKFLKPGGQMLLEIGYDQGTSVPSILRQWGYVQCRVVRDLAGLDRVVAAVRV